MISQKSVQEIIETAKIEDVVEEFVSLRTRGVNMIGLCPFHNEKTPSFTVSPTKNIFKCFGCGKGGNPVQFLMEHENFSFPEALRYLAKKYNIEIEETVSSPEALEERQLLDSMYIVNEGAMQYYQDQLFKTDQGRSIGLSYFKERGFREEIIKKFGLGYAPYKEEGFTFNAIEKGYNIDLLKKLGLSTKFDRDFFRNRVMFTIRNLSGKVIGFAGRILQKNVKAPKYINSPETEIYNKSKALYGAYFAKSAIRKASECILVEGYTDVISLHQSGIENVVASSGTSLTVDQIRLIKRFTPNIKILYDGDTAGVKAALRGLDLVLEQDMNVKVVLLPQNEDPDSYLQKVGLTAFKEYLEKFAQDFILFKTNLLLEEAAGDPIKKSRLVHDIVGSIAKIPDPIKRSIYVKECALVMDLEEKVLIVETNKVVTENIHKNINYKERKPPTPSDDGYFPEKEISVQDSHLEDRAVMPTATSEGAFQEQDIVRLLVAFGGEVFDKEEEMTVAEYLLKNIIEIIHDFDNKTYGRIAQECLKLQQLNKPISQEHFINHRDQEISQTAINLIHSPFEYSSGWEDREIFLRSQSKPEANFAKDSIQGLRRFKLRKIMKMCEENAQRIKHLGPESDPDQLLKLMKLQQRLIESRNELANQLNTVILK